MLVVLCGDRGQRVNHLGACKRGTRADLPASPMLLLTCGRGPRCLPGVGGAMLSGLLLLTKVG